MTNNAKRIKIGLCGADGRMGQAITRLVNDSDKNFIISSKYTRNNTTGVPNLCKKSEVIIDFSSPAILELLLQNCITFQKAIVIGTTPLSKDHMNYITQAAQKIPIVYSANMTIGANLIAILGAITAQVLRKNYDIEIVDYHHKLKKDAPSGTAIMLGKAIAKAKGLKFENCTVFNKVFEYTKDVNTIGFSSIRGGTIPGKHEILFAGNNEVVSINHQIYDRATFAEGALKAAAWIQGREPGLYSMKDVIGLDLENLTV